MQYTQDTLFPDSEVVGTGKPFPWNPDDEPVQELPPFQVEVLFDQEPQP